MSTFRVWRRLDRLLIYPREFIIWTSQYLSYFVIWSSSPFFSPSHTRDWVVQLAARCNHFSPVVTNGQVWTNNLKITPRKRAGKNLNQQLSEHKHKDCCLPSTVAPKDKTHEEKAQTVTEMWSKIKKRCKNIQNTNMQKNSKRKHAGRGSGGPSLTQSRKKVFLLKLIGRR